MCQPCPSSPPQHCDGPLLEAHHLAGAVVWPHFPPPPTQHRLTCPFFLDGSNVTDFMCSFSFSSLVRRISGNYEGTTACSSVNEFLCCQKGHINQLHSIVSRTRAGRDETEQERAGRGKEKTGEERVGLEGPGEGTMTPRSRAAPG